MALRIGRLSHEEAHALRMLTRSRGTPLRVLQRACIVWLSAQGKSVPEIASEVGVSHHTVRLWLTRFVDLGVAGLNDMPRPGARRQYDAAIVADVVGIARSSPRELGLPVARWTLDQMVAYLQACRGITIKRSRLSEVLQAASVDWRQSNDEAVDATNDRSRQESEPAQVTSRRPSVNRRVRKSIRRLRAGDDRITPTYVSSVRPRKDGGSMSLGRGPSRWRPVGVEDVPEQAT